MLGEKLWFWGKEWVEDPQRNSFPNGEAVGDQLSKTRPSHDEHSCQAQKWRRETERKGEEVGEVQGDNPWEADLGGKLIPNEHQFYDGSCQG